MKERKYVFVKDQSGDVLGIKIGANFYKGGLDERGPYLVSVCPKCGREYKNHSFLERRRGRKRKYCDDCSPAKRFPGKGKGEEKTLISGAVVLQTAPPASLFQGETTKGDDEAVREKRGGEKRGESGEPSSLRVAVFVDGPNLHKGLRSHGVTAPIDYNALAEELAKRVEAFFASPPKLVRKVFVNGVLLDEDGRIQGRRRTDALRHKGWIVREVTVKIRENGELKEKGLDARLGLELYDGAKGDVYDVAVLVSGDADFVPFVERVESVGKRVLVAQYHDLLSRDLVNVASGLIRFEDVDFSQLVYSVDGAQRERNAAHPNGAT